jgi:tetratricopeptide (TPR) repeat protein
MIVAGACALACALLAPAPPAVPGDRMPGGGAALARRAAALLAPGRAAWAGEAAGETLTLLREIERSTGRAVLDGADKLARLGPGAVPALAEFLRRPHVASDAERRALLAAIGAEVPDEKGRFRAPGRLTAAQQAAGDSADWLSQLAGLAPAPGHGEVMADVSAIRALAATRDVQAAQHILDFAFDPVGQIYRDECGRMLREMAPYSLPALIRGSQHQQRSSSLARYANYQLERLDRQDAFKALAAAPSDSIKAEILRAYGDSYYREAVYAVLAHVDHVAPAVRKAARAAWMLYVDGEPPPPAPTKRLVLPGGKLTEEPEPLWLTHRELADIELRKLLTQRTGSAPPAKATLVEMSKQVFELADQARRKQLDQEFEAALALARARKWAEAASAYDRVLVQDPHFPRRGEMVAAYTEYAHTLEAAGKWRAASTTYAKAHAMAPDGPAAEELLAQHHFTRGKALEAEGKVARQSFERAREMHTRATGRPAGGPRWMLYAGAAAAALAALIAAIALLGRRRPQPGAS